MFLRWFSESEFSSGPGVCVCPAPRIQDGKLCGFRTLGAFVGRGCGPPFAAVAALGNCYDLSPGKSRPS